MATSLSKVSMASNSCRKRKPMKPEAPVTATTEAGAPVVMLDLVYEIELENAKAAHLEGHADSVRTFAQSNAVGVMTVALLRAMAKGLSLVTFWKETTSLSR